MNRADRAEEGRPGDRDETRILALVMHAAFFVLLAASLARYLARHAA